MGVVHRWLQMGKKEGTHCTSVVVHIPVSPTVPQTPLPQLTHNGRLSHDRLTEERKGWAWLTDWWDWNVGARGKLAADILQPHSGRSWKTTVRGNSSSGQSFRQYGKRSSLKQEYTLAHGSVGWIDWLVRAWKEEAREQGGTRQKMGKKCAAGSMGVAPTIKIFVSHL